MTFRHVQLVHTQVVIDNEGVGQAVATAEMDVLAAELDGFIEQYEAAWKITVSNVCPPSCTAQLAKEAS
jgi:hypothetical protein